MIDSACYVLFFAMSLVSSTDQNNVYRRTRLESRKQDGGFRLKLNRNKLELSRHCNSDLRKSEVNITLK